MEQIHLLCPIHKACFYKRLRVLDPDEEAHRKARKYIVARNPTVNLAVGMEPGLIGFGNTSDRQGTIYTGRTLCAPTTSITDPNGVPLIVFPLLFHSGPYWRNPVHGQVSMEQRKEETNAVAFMQ